MEKVKWSPGECLMCWKTIDEHEKKITVTFTNKNDNIEESFEFCDYNCVTEYLHVFEDKLPF